jgi:hypothetical protein
MWQCECEMSSSGDDGKWKPSQKCAHLTRKQANFNFQQQDVVLQLDFFVVTSSFAQGLCWQQCEFQVFQQDDLSVEAMNIHKHP